MARAETPTLLSLPRYAKIMGIVPPNFNSGTLGIYFNVGDCSSIWQQYQWQAFDAVSREELATEINNAENEIAAFVGFYPAPKFIAQDKYEYPRYHRRDLWQSDLANVRGTLKSINLRKGRGKFLSPGQRGIALVGTATTAGGTLVYADLDGDGVKEDAAITLPTTLTDVNEIKVYFPGHSGDPAWEIRGEKSKILTGGNVVLHFWLWDFPLPALWEQFPTDAGITPIDFTDTTKLLTSVEVYREYIDTTSAAAQFLWNSDVACSICGGSGCSICTYQAQSGCLYARDFDASVVVPFPADYDAINGWVEATLTQGRDPDIVQLWYVAGDQDQRYLQGFTHDPLSEYWARMIAFMATARLERPLCNCANSHALAEWLREDLAFTPEGGGSRFTVQDVQESAFGTHRGEVMAYLQVKKLQERVTRGVAI